jgi:hypothetical protein
MSFLEFACRLCNSDTSGVAIQEFSMELDRIEPRYFSKIDGLHIPSKISLPYIGASTNDTLICALFDLIRNGLAHQYQQTLVTSEYGTWGIQLSGPGHTMTIEHNRRLRRRTMYHLTTRLGREEIMWLRISPARMYLDFKEAFDAAKLLEKGLTIDPLKRPDPEGYSNYRYNFNFTKIAAAVSTESDAFAKTYPPRKPTKAKRHVSKSK